MSSGASLNHIFRTVWNQALGAMVAIAETGTSAGRGAARRSKLGDVQRLPDARLGLLALSIAVAWCAGSLSAQANPTGGVATVGQLATVSNGNTLQVTTQNGAGTNFSAINWQSFSIPAGSSTYFQQPNANSTSINRVVTNTPSQLFGTLSSNGSLVLVNQSGIAVGAGAVVDTAGFTASSLAMSDQDAMAGRLRFGNGSISTADVAVNGAVLARSGDVVLLGPSVQIGQDALIQAPNGNAILAAGQQIDITERGLEGIRLQVQAPANAVLNLGSLKADAVGLFAGTLKHSGLIQATAASDSGGRVVLKAQDLLSISGEVHAKQLGGMGGEILASANKVLLQPAAVLDASGENGGGEVLVGGGWQGHDARLANASQTVVAAGAQLRADALVQGNGGTAVVWSDGGTRFAGTVSAVGGVLGGDGGRAEVSGKQFLDFQGSANLTAAKGSLGLLLLDPASLTIENANPNVDGTPGNDVTGDILSTDFGTINSVITAGVVGGLLNSASLSLTATGAVIVNAPITKASGTTTTLTLASSSGSVSVNAAIDGSTGSPLNVTLNANSSVSIGGAINTHGGAVTLSAFGGSISQTAPITAASVAASAYSGITLSDSANSVPSFSATNGMANDISFATTGAVNLGTISNSIGNLSITANGAVTQSGIISVGGSTSIDAGVGSINLSNTSNALSGAIYLDTLGSSNATLKNNGSINMGGASVGGTLALFPLATGSSLSQTGSISANVLDITMNPVGNGSVSLTNSGNAVSTLNLVSTGTGQINYFNNAALTLGPFTAGGNVSLVTSSGSNISQSVGAIGVVGNASIQSGNSSTGYGSVVLMTPTNDFGSVSLVGTQVSVKDANALTLSGLYADSGASLVQSVGAMTLTGLVKTYAAGDAVKFISGGTFNSTAGSFSFLGGGRWLAYLGTPGAESFNTGSAPPAFKQYNASNGSTVLGTGNGVLYSAAPVLSGVLSGAVSKIYDGGLSISPSGASVGGLGGALGFDDISAASATPTAANLSDPNVGTGKSVTVSGSVAGVVGGSSDLYFFTKPIYGYQFSATGTIGAVTPAQASVNLTGSRAYDGTNVVNAGIFTIGGLAAGELLTLSGFGTVADKNVGTNKTVNLGSLTLGNGVGGLASNYTFIGGTHMASITPATLEVTGGNRVYDGTNVVSASLLGLNGLVAGETLTLLGSGTVADKNVGVDKPITLSSLALASGSGLVSNYVLSSNTQNAVLTITPKSVDVSGLTSSNKEYDGKLSAQVGSGGAVFTGLVSGDAVTLASAQGTFSDKNVGVGKTVVFSNFDLAGLDARNYEIANSNSAKADIFARSSSSWIGATGGLWSDPNNWDVIPDGANVLAVTVPANRGTLTVDASAGAIQLQSFTSESGFVITGGSLQVTNNFTSNGYVQSGGSVGGAGVFDVKGSFNQTAGNLSFGSVSVVQTTGDLNFANITAPTVSLNALSGAIRESGALVATKAVTTTSTAGTFLNNTGNRIAEFGATNTGSGNIELVNTGVLPIVRITNTGGGSIIVSNTGGITTQELISAPGGSISLTANSPLTIGTGGVFAQGNVNLVATNLTSSGNMTLNGPIESGSGAVNLNAGNDLTQNSSILAPLGVSATAGGTLTVGPQATTGYQPVSYIVNNVPVSPPRSPASNNVATDQIVSLMQSSPILTNSREIAPVDTLLGKDKERDLSKELIVSEGQVCRP